MARRDQVKRFASEYRWPLGGVLVLLALAFVTPVVAGINASRAEILDAIRMVESGGRDDCPDGDDGKAIGPFQIHEIYWRDAVAAQPELGPKGGYGYQDCRDRAYAVRVIDAYMQRWVAEAWRDNDAEVIARTHNGGPRGASKRATDGYWEKVRRELLR